MADAPVTAKKKAPAGIDTDRRPEVEPPRPSLAETVAVPDPAVNGSRRVLPHAVRLAMFRRLMAWAVGDADRPDG